MLSVFLDPLKRYVFSSVLLIGWITLLAFHTTNQICSAGVTPLITVFVSPGSRHWDRWQKQQICAVSQCRGPEVWEQRRAGPCSLGGSGRGPFLAVSRFSWWSATLALLGLITSASIGVLSLCACLPEMHSSPLAFCCSCWGVNHMGPWAHTNPGWPCHNVTDYTRRDSISKYGHVHRYPGLEFQQIFLGATIQLTVTMIHYPFCIFLDSIC